MKDLQRRLMHSLGSTSFSGAMYSTSVALVHSGILLTLRDMPEAHEVAQSLLFAPPMVEVANKILRNITDDSGQLLNGLHLRLEGDAKAHHLFSDVGGEQVRKYPHVCNGNEAYGPV